MTNSFEVLLYDCDIGSVVQPNIKYLINRGQLETFSFVENTDIDQTRCNSDTVTVNGTLADTLPFIFSETDFNIISKSSHD